MILLLNSSFCTGNSIYNVGLFAIGIKTCKLKSTPYVIIVIMARSCIQGFFKTGQEKLNDVPVKRFVWSSHNAPSGQRMLTIAFFILQSHLVNRFWTYMCCLNFIAVMIPPYFLEICRLWRHIVIALPLFLSIKHRNSIDIIYVRR